VLKLYKLIQAFDDRSD